MACIHLLEDQIINKIAAGEVVERPTSVVKELVENAIDAGATSITVELEEGGRRRISVHDNGVGMSRDDAYMAVKRHATSKIAKVDDLFAVQSMGFRGEALASIASVSRFSIATRRSADDVGCKVSWQGGEEPSELPWQGAAGTCVTVEDLFFNVPARAKFLKTASSEYAHCLELMQSLALSRPGVGLTLMHNGREKLRVGAIAALAGSAEQSPSLAPGAGMGQMGEAVLRQRVGAVWGEDAVAPLLYVLEANQYGTFEALISPPGIEKATAKSLVCFVNGRWVKDKVLRYGIMRGYQSHLLKGRYPQVVGYLYTDPSLIDVNVHPAKTELRFQYGGEVQGILALGVRKTLRQAAWHMPAASTTRSRPASMVASRYDKHSEKTVAEKRGDGDEGSHDGKDAGELWDHAQGMMTATDADEQQQVSTPEGVDHHPPTRSAAAYPKSVSSSGSHDLAGPGAAQSKPENERAGASSYARRHSDASPYQSFGQADHERPPPARSQATSSTNERRLNDERPQAYAPAGKSEERAAAPSPVPSAPTYSTRSVSSDRPSASAPFGESSVRAGHREASQNVSSDSHAQTYAQQHSGRHTSESDSNAANNAANNADRQARDPGSQPAASMRQVSSWPPPDLFAASATQPAEECGSQEQIPWHELTHVGSFSNCYLFFAMQGRLLVVDQHAFHERIIFERLQRDRQLLQESQALVIPEVISLDAAAVIALAERQAELASLGFRFAPVDAQSLEVQAVPSLLTGKNLEALFAELASQHYADGALQESGPAVLDHVLATIACHSAVRAGEALGQDEWRCLLNEAQQVDFYHNCPHGRRVFKWFSKQQVERWFDR